VSALTGTIDATGTTITFAAGQTVPAWDGSVNTLVGAQAYGYVGNASVIAAGATVASVASGGHSLTLSPAGAGLANATGVKVILSQAWAAARTRLYYDLNNIPPFIVTTSKGVGYMGSDGFNSIDLSPGLSGGAKASLLWLADGSWATAANQSRAAGAFLHSKVMLTEGSAFATATQTWHPDPAFVEDDNKDVLPDPAGYYYWPLGGICLNNSGIIVTTTRNDGGNIFGVGQDAWFATHVFSGTSAVIVPTSAWVWTQLVSPFNMLGVGNPSPNWIDAGDGYVYAFLTTANQNMYATRWPKADLTAFPPTLLGMQVWVGAWEPALRSTGALSRRIPSVVGNAAASKIAIGSLYRKSTGQFVVSNYDYANPGTAGIGYVAFAPNTGVPSVDFPGTWSQRFPIWNTGVQAFQSYLMWTHPEWTWTGQAVDDVCFTYNVAGSATDQTTGWSTFIRTTGI
jgi:hypothetical protein